MLYLKFERIQLRPFGVAQETRLCLASGSRCLRRCQVLVQHLHDIMGIDPVVMINYQWLANAYQLNSDRLTIKNEGPINVNLPLLLFYYYCYCIWLFLLYLYICRLQYAYYF